MIGKLRSSGKSFSGTSQFPNQSVTDRQRIRCFSLPCAQLNLQLLAEVRPHALDWLGWNKKTSGSRDFQRAMADVADVGEHADVWCLMMKKFYCTRKDLAMWAYTFSAVQVGLLLMFMFTSHMEHLILFWGTRVLVSKSAAWGPKTADGVSKSERWDEKKVILRPHNHEMTMHLCCFHAFRLGKQK